MDSAIAIITINKMKTPKKDEIVLTTYTAPVEENNFLLTSIFYLIIFAFASYLSWSCNSKCIPDMSGVEKVLRSFIAGIFGTIYLLIYLISWSAGCRTCSKV
jgi:hypothetical protein